MKNVIYLIFTILTISLTIYFSFFQKEDPTLDSIRIKTAEARNREIQATKDRETAEDALQIAIDNTCYQKALTLTGIRYSEQKIKASECSKNELTKINTGSADAPQASLPPKSITSSYVSIKSTLRGDNVSNQSSGSKIQPTLKTPGKSVAITLQNGGSIPGSPDKNGSGKKDQQGGIQKVCPTKTILRKGWNDPRVQFAYNLSCGDMDFIKTIEAESKWDVNALGDQGHSFGLCQINKLYNPEMQRLYRNLKSDNEKVSFCYTQYSEWKKRGVLPTRLYGYNVRNLPTNLKPFTFK